MVGGSNPPSATSPTSPDPLDALARPVALGAARLGIDDDAAIVLAVSGGPDSTALLHGAAHLVRADVYQWRLTVAHLDHAVRPTSADDAATVRAQAAELGLAFELRRTDVAALAAAEHRSLEDAGRRARYAFLEEIAATLAADALIATAHTADDQAETILLRLVRGSGLRGIRGIPERRGPLVRPLLHARRAALKAALDDAGIHYATDPTNADPAHADRNRLRAEVLPALERLNPAAVEALTRFGRLAADDDELLDALAAAELARRRDPADGSIDWRHPPARALGRRILRLAIGDRAPSAERIETLLEAAEGDRGGLAIELGGDRRARVRSRRIGLD